MKQTLILACLLAVPISAASTALADGDKDAKKPDPKEKAATDKLLASSGFMGRLVRVEGAQKYITVQVSIPIAVPNGANLGNSLALLQLQQQMVTQRNPMQRQLLQLQMLQLAAAGGGGYNFRQINKNIDLQAVDDLKVRSLQLPADFDEKGRPKRYTSKELHELKGDPKLPGYTSDFDSLKPDQIVRVYLAKKKEAPKPAVKEKPKEKDKDGDKDRTAEERPEITMVVILREPQK
ncbi:MAG TPA: hypothetical protein VK395_24235 [Gemmataceae bacterium]|nr:hypothetical protein [Gemmataceae bacterium]